MSLYIYAAIILAGLLLIFLTVRWWKLPQTIEQRRLAAEEADKRRQARIDNRRPIFRRK